MNRMKRRWKLGPGVAAWLLVVLLGTIGWGQAWARDVTVTAVVTVDDLSAAHIPLVSLMATEGAPGDQVLGLHWQHVESGWFPSWNLVVSGSAGLLDRHTKAVVTSAGAATVDLGSVLPQKGHTYEVTLSYSSRYELLALRVYDATAGESVYTGTVAAGSYAGPLFAADAELQPYFVPLGVGWKTGVVDDSGSFLPLSQFTHRDEEAFVRVTSPAALSGQFRLLYEHGGQRRELLTFEAASGEQVARLPLDAFALGPAVLRLQYVEDDHELLSETKRVALGRVAVFMDKLVPDPEARTVATSVRITGSEPSMDSVTLDLRFVLYELVWDASRAGFVERRAGEIALHDGPVALVNGQGTVPVEVAMPDQGGSWRVELEADVRPDMSLQIGGQGRYFSSYEAAHVADGEPYTVVVLPDTQFMAARYPHIYLRMTDWVAANAVDLGITAVWHVGDITDNDTPPQWDNAYNAMSLLHGVVPYALTLGNHDMTNGKTGLVYTRGLTLINNHFTADEARRYSGLAGTMVPDRLENHYHEFSMGGVEYVVIALEFGPPDEAIAWANDVAQQYPDHRVVLLTHSYTALSGARSRSPENTDLARDPLTTVNSAPDMWSKFVQPNDNVFMVVSGHLSAPLTVPHGVPRVGSRSVFELLFNYQAEPRGGNGWLSLMTFYPDDTVDVRIYSPYLDEWADAQDTHGFTSRLVLHLNTGRVDRLRP